MLYSYVKDLGPIFLPPWNNRQLPRFSCLPRNIHTLFNFEDYHEIINQLCSLCEIETTLYLTIDESIVEKGHTQRRPEIHIDGCWIPLKFKETILRHNSRLIFNHVKRMPFIACTNSTPCRVFEGEYDIPAQYHGDYSEFISLFGKGRVLEPNRAYFFSADCLHQSNPVLERTKRTFFRIAFHNNKYEEDYTIRALSRFL